MKSLRDLSPAEQAARLRQFGRNVGDGGKLQPEEAGKLYRRLTGKRRQFPEAVARVEVYAVAAEAGLKPSRKRTAERPRETDRELRQWLWSLTEPA